MDARPRYLECRLDEFFEQVASADLLPGAGFVSAVGVAMAAGLVAMSARLSVEHWPEALAVSAQAETLRDRVTPLAEMNADAYAKAVAVLRGDGEAEGPVSRDDEIAGALERSAWIPLKIGEAAADVTALAATVAERGEPSLRPDAIVAALIAHAATEAAATLVEVNLTTTPGDERVAEARSLVGAASVALERARTAS